MRWGLALALLACACAPKRWLALDEKDLAPGVWPEAPAERLLDETTVRFRLEKGVPVMEVTEHVATRFLRSDVAGVLVISETPGLAEVLEASVRKVEPSGRVVAERVADRGPVWCATGQRTLKLPLGRVDPGQVREWRVTRLLREPLELGHRLSLRREVPVKERRLIVEAPEGWEVSLSVPEGHSVTPNLDRRGGLTRTLLAWFQIAAEESEPLSSEEPPEVFLQLRAWRDGEAVHPLPATVHELAQALAARVLPKGISRSPGTPDAKEIRSVVRAARADFERCVLRHDSRLSLSSAKDLDLAVEVARRLEGRGAAVELGLAVPHRGRPNASAPAALEGMKVPLVRVNGAWVDPMSDSTHLRRLVVGAPVLVINPATESLETLPWTSSAQSEEVLSLNVERSGDGLVGQWQADRTETWSDGSIRPWLPPKLSRLQGCDMEPCPFEGDVGVGDPEHTAGKVNFPGVWPEDEPLTLSRVRGTLPTLPADSHRQHDVVLGPPRTERFRFHLKGARLSVTPKVVETPVLRATLEPTADGGVERVDVWKVPVVEAAQYDRVREALTAASALDEEPLSVELLR